MLTTIPHVHTLAELLHAYEHDFLPHKAPDTQRQYRLLYRWFCQELGSIPLAELTPARLQRWIDTLRPYYQPGSIRRYLTALSGPLRMAVEHYQWMPTHPLRRVIAPPAPPGRERCLDADELQALLAACKANVNPHLYLAVVVGLSTAARKNEILRRQWRDLDLTRGTLRLRQTKNGARRPVPLVGRALALLRARAAEGGASPWVFPQARNPQRPAYIDAAWVRACTMASVVDLHFHDLRHTAASYLAMSGASIRDIAEVLGHKNIQQSMRYTHLMEPHTRSVVEKMVDTFLATVLLASTLTTLASVWLVWG